MNGLDIALLNVLVFIIGIIVGILIMSHNKLWIPKKDIEEIDISKYDDVMFEEKESKWDKFKKGFGNLFIL